VSDSTLVDLFRHHAWANDRLVRACEPLDDAVLDATVPGTFGSIRDTLRHVAFNEERYLAFLNGQEPPETNDVPSNPAAIRERLRRSGEGFIAVAERLAPGTVLRSEYEGESVALPASILVIHAINHATEHRAQIAAILTQNGIEPPSMDGWTYLETMAAPASSSSS
jgi:uncharacterized damage-inducible protein DinB